MYQLQLICGEWRGEDNRWLFYVDKSHGSKTIMLDEGTNLEDLEAMVFKAFGLTQRCYYVTLSYRYPSVVMRNLPQDTPPVFMEDNNAIRVFLEQYWKDSGRICVQFYEKSNVESDVVGDEEADGCKLGDQSCRFADKSCRFSDESCRFADNVDAEKDNNDVGEENDNDEENGEFRFDYCDDPDGASSGDEDYISCSRVKNDEECEGNTNLPSRKRDMLSRDEYVGLELSAVDLAVGQCYPSKEELETRLKIAAVTRRFDFDVVASTKLLLRVKCWVPGCQWKLRASKIDESSCFYVKSYVHAHTCSVTERSCRTRQATPYILARLYIDFVGGVGPSVLPIHVADALTKRYGLKVKYWKAHRTLREARVLVRGTSECSYAQLPSYLFMIRRANPGTLIKLEVDGDHKFKFLFVAFDASIQGFLYMRKVVVVDGTFLQGKYKGTLLTATMQDGNFQIFPIAFGVVDTENDESWEWFFRQLNRIIPDDAELAIISDRHRSIGNAIKKVFPLSARGICTYHLRKNIVLKFRGGESFKLFKRAATAYRIEEFNQILGQIQELNPPLHAYLLQADVRMWSRVHFPGNRYNITTTNIAESINHALSEARTYPIVQLIDSIRSMLTRWFATRRKNASLMTTALTSGVEKVLKRRMEEASNYDVQPIDEHQTQVTNISSTNIVNLSEKRCSCKRFELDKIPCVHAIAAAEHASLPIVSLTHSYFHTTYLYNAYARCVKPRDSAMPVPEEVHAKVCKPPSIRKQSGRPKISRIKGAVEVVKPTKRPRKAYSCTKCLKPGHNSRTCPE